MSLRQSWMLWLLVAGACASHRNFTPRENQNGSGPGGQPAAVYTIVSGDARGEVRLWSRGSDAVDQGGGQDGGKVAELHLGFEIENTGKEPLQLVAGALQCDDLWVGEQRVQGLTPVRTAGEPLAAPGTTSRFEAWFRPGLGGPRDIEAFAVRFRVDGPAGELLTQVTPFSPYLSLGSRYDDPWFWHSGFGFGFYGRYRRW